MRPRIWVALGICVLLVLTPFIVKGIENSESSTSSIPVSGGSSTITETSSGVIYSGSLESHQGADTLIVTPAEAYVPAPGAIIYVNVTVKFFHAQPCPHPGWKISIENVKNAKVVYSSETKLVNPYTAEKTYKLEILGNGSADIVYYYGPGCPYGTEERVTVHFYVGTPSEEKTSTLTSQNLTSQQNTSFWLNGTLEKVDLNSGEIKVANYTISIKGKWTGQGNQSYPWRKLANVLEGYKGEYIKVLAEKGQEGILLAKEIEIAGKVYWRG